MERGRMRDMSVFICICYICKYVLYVLHMQIHQIAHIYIHMSCCIVKYNTLQIEFWFQFIYSIFTLSYSLFSPENTFKYFWGKKEMLWQFQLSLQLLSLFVSLLRLHNLNIKKHGAVTNDFPVLTVLAAAFQYR